MKDKVKLLDSAFSHSILGYCSDFQTTENFEWDRNVNGDENILVITDTFLKHDMPKVKNKVAWLIEPMCVAKRNYNYIRRNNLKFEYVLTHEKTLLDLGKNYRFLPFGCCWISEEDKKIYDKSKNISIISSDKSFTDGHRLRHKIVSKYKDKMDVFGRG